MNRLDLVIDAKRESVARKKGPRHLQELKSRIGDQQPTRPFQNAIARLGNDPIKLIAEIKKASPSQGILRERFDPVEIAKTYQEGGASALSVLTEEHFFLGSLAYLNAVRSVVSLPILQKDFIIDELQVYEARAFGADAILLILALLTQQQAIDYFLLASELSLATLVEVHTEAELAVALPWANIVGINARDLRSFTTDIQIVPLMMKTISAPIRAQKRMIAESGIRSRADVVLLEEAGADAMLIGEAFMVSDSIEKKMREILGEAIEG